ncbi:hypothetical protein EON09_18605 [Pseudomonas soli]|jgi:hypothetical protein|uniref:Uncharacterized protein n=2 Tax=Pseudomonas soli TaxID=1306993 RepID=A0AAJ5MG90_9PSED|nr:MULTISPECIES: hypothetical protein [Pseudomonas]MCX5510213.1 hypothetical protein [Pseudomonas sp. BJa3]MDT3716675.1 hypothetical protein [Pseudomonas soli]MDT3733407.1 hypothetical protein [Pseudomonas soli]MDW9403790.1 hypothetical protein [Pseudomonas soli]MEE1882194.1 hypothetical protein [Pseudomonas soli]
MSDSKNAGKDATNNASSLARKECWSSVAHYRRANMHENTETRREARNISDREMPRYIVIPAGNAFYHIAERDTGRVRGFRQCHKQACALARHFER